MSANAAAARALQPAPPVQEQAGTPVGKRAAGARVLVSAELLDLLEGPGTGESDPGQSRVEGLTACASALQLAPKVQEQAGTPAGVHAPGAGTAIGAELLVQEGPGTGRGDSGQSQGSAAVHGAMDKHQLQQASGNGQSRKGMVGRVAELLDTYALQISVFPFMMLLPSFPAAAYLSFSTPDGSEPNFWDPFVCLSVLIFGAMMLSFPCSIVLLLVNVVLHCLG